TARSSPKPPAKSTADAAGRPFASAPQRRRAIGVTPGRPAVQPSRGARWQFARWRPRLAAFRGLLNNRGSFAEFRRGSNAMRSLKVLVAMLVPLAAFTPAQAHHSFAAAYDMNDPISITGKIVQVRLTNPHSWFFL